MEKLEQILQILDEVKEQSEELSNDPSTDSMSAEEIVILATELVLSQPIETIEYSPLIGEVDVSRVSFMIDEEYELPLFQEFNDEL